MTVNIDHMKGRLWPLRCPGLLARVSTILKGVTKTLILDFCFLILYGLPQISLDTRHKCSNSQELFYYVILFLFCFIFQYIFLFFYLYLYILFYLYIFFTFHFIYMTETTFKAGLETDSDHIEWCKCNPATFCIWFFAKYSSVLSLNSFCLIF